MSKNSKEFQYERAGIPKRFSEITWDTVTDISDKDKQRALLFVENYPDNHKSGLYIHGKISGTGKTTFGICTLKALIESGKTKRTSYFVTFVDLMDDFRALILSGQSLNSTKLFKKLTTADLVILDDVGVEKMNESMAKRYYTLLDHLWREQKHVIITSKFDIEELINRADEGVDIELLESIASRIQGMCEIIRLRNQKDFRTK